MKVRIGTRGSDLALIQARGAARRLEELGCETELVIVKTSGDADQTSPYAAIGEPGVFVREIEQALRDGRVDVAVHSCKDLPSISPEDLVIGAIPERLDPADVLLIHPDAHDPRQVGLPLKAGSVVGTSSARRQALIKEYCPDLEIGPMRGNVPTRVGKVHDGKVNATLLAIAGLNRLQSTGSPHESLKHLSERLVVFHLDPAVFIPAPSQAAIAYQIRRDDQAVAKVVSQLDDPAAHRPVMAERALQRLVEGGCQVPFGALCRSTGEEELHITAFLERGGVLRLAEGRGTSGEALAQQVYQQLQPKEATRP